MHPCYPVSPPWDRRQLLTCVPRLSGLPARLPLPVLPSPGLPAGWPLCCGGTPVNPPYLHACHPSALLCSGSFTDDLAEVCVSALMSFGHTGTVDG